MELTAFKSLAGKQSSQYDRQTDRQTCTHARMCARRPGPVPRFCKHARCYASMQRRCLICVLSTLNLPTEMLCKDSRVCECVCVSRCVTSSGQQMLRPTSTLKLFFSSPHRAPDIQCDQTSQILCVCVKHCEHSCKKR